jgi:hypothetical protein
MRAFGLNVYRHNAASFEFVKKEAPLKQRHDTKHQTGGYETKCILQFFCKKLRTVCARISRLCSQVYINISNKHFGAPRWHRKFVICTNFWSVPYWKCVSHRENHHDIQQTRLGLSWKGSYLLPSKIKTWLQDVAYEPLPVPRDVRQLNRINSLQTKWKYFYIHSSPTLIRYLQAQPFVVPVRAGNTGCNYNAWENFKSQFFTSKLGKQFLQT